MEIFYLEIYFVNNIIDYNIVERNNSFNNIGVNIGTWK